jgi:hypothetical protein
MLPIHANADWSTICPVPKNILIRWFCSINLINHDSSTHALGLRGRFLGHASQPTGYELPVGARRHPFASINSDRRPP